MCGFKFPIDDYIGMIIICSNGIYKLNIDNLQNKVICLTKDRYAYFNIGRRICSLQKIESTNINLHYYTSNCMVNALHKVYILCMIIYTYRKSVTVTEKKVWFKKKEVRKKMVSINMTRLIILFSSISLWSIFNASWPTAGTVAKDVLQV